MMTCFTPALRLTLALLTMTSIFLVCPAAAQDNSSPQTTPLPKELLLPQRISRVPDQNDFTNKDSEFSFHRMVQGDNIAISWSKEYGDDPMANPETFRSP